MTDCAHKWQHIVTKQYNFSESMGYDEIESRWFKKKKLKRRPATWYYGRIDAYYCSTCLEDKEILRCVPERNGIPPWISAAWEVEFHYSDDPLMDDYWRETKSRLLEVAGVLFR